MSGDYLTKLRQKPKHVRDNIAFAIASGVTSIVALFVVFAVHGPKVVGELAGQKEQPQFFETLINQAKQQVAATKASMKSQKDQDSSITTIPAASNGSGAPAPAILTSSSSASTTASTVLIATTSASSSLLLPADE